MFDSFRKEIQDVVCGEKTKATSERLARFWRALDEDLGQIEECLTGAIGDLSVRVQESLEHFEEEEPVIEVLIHEEEEGFTLEIPCPENQAIDLSSFSVEEVDDGRILIHGKFYQENVRKIPIRGEDE